MEASTWCTSCAAKTPPPPPRPPLLPDATAPALETIRVSISCEASPPQPPPPPVGHFSSHSGDSSSREQRASLARRADSSSAPSCAPQIAALLGDADNGAVAAAVDGRAVVGACSDATSWDDGYGGCGLPGRKMRATVWRMELAPPLPRPPPQSPSSEDGVEEEMLRAILTARTWWWRWRCMDDFRSMHTPPFTTPPFTAISLQLQSSFIHLHMTIHL